VSIFIGVRVSVAAMIFLSPCNWKPAFMGSVKDVLALRSQEKMFKIAAGAIVALMTNQQAIGYWPIG